MKTIEIERRRGFYGMARQLLIDVDGQQVAKIKQGQKLSVTIDDSAQTLCGRMDWATTEGVNLQNVPDGARIVFKGKLSISTKKNLAVTTTMPFDVSVETR